MKKINMSPCYDPDCGGMIFHFGADDEWNLYIRCVKCNLTVGLGLKIDPSKLEVPEVLRQKHIHKHVEVFQ